MAGDFILVAGLSGTCVRAAECSLREVNEVACIERPGKRRCEGMITVFEPELGYCIRVPGENVEALSSRELWFGKLSKCRAAISVSSELHGGFAFHLRLGNSYIGGTNSKLRAVCDANRKA